jgi:polar amino acid transport system substrate-binding protein
MSLHAKNQQIIPLTFCCLNLVLLVTLLIIATTKSAQAERDTCDSLKVGGSNEWVPIAHINKRTQQPEGIAYQIAILLGEHMGIPVAIEANYPWARMMDMARNGELDLLAGLVSNPERAKFLHFTVPFYRNSMYVFVHKNAVMQPTSVEDLLSYKRVEARGRSIGEELDTLLKATTIIVNEDSQLTSLVASGRADYFVASLTGFSTLHSKSAQSSSIKRLQLPINTLDVSIAVSKASPCVKHLDVFNRVITKFYPLDR